MRTPAKLLRHVDISGKIFIACLVERCEGHCKDSTDFRECVLSGSEGTVLDNISFNSLPGAVIPALEKSTMANFAIINYIRGLLN